MYKNILDLDFVEETASNITPEKDENEKKI